MKYLLFAFLSAIAPVYPAYGVDYADWVRSTDRSSNPDIIRLMAEGDLSQALEIAAALGSRPDPYISDLIAHYLALYRHGRQYEYELVLLTMITAVFRHGPDEGDLTARLETNRDALGELIEACEGFESPALKAACIGLAVFGGADPAAPLVGREGGRLALNLRKNRGRLDRAETEEAFVILDAIEKLNMKEFRSLLADFARLSDDRRIVERARALAAALD